MPWDFEDSIPEVFSHRSASGSERIIDSTWLEIRPPFFRPLKRASRLILISDPRVARCALTLGYVIKRFQRWEDSRTRVTARLQSHSRYSCRAACD